MSRPPRPGSSPATAGILLLTAVLLCAALGGVVGAAIGALGPLLIVGVFAGFFAGTWIVYRRFRDL